MLSRFKLSTLHIAEDTKDVKFTKIFFSDQITKMFLKFDI